MGALGYMAVCMAMWGLATFAMKVAGQRLDPMTVAVFNLFGYFSIGAFLLPKASYGLTLHHGIGVAIGAMFVVGNLAFYKLSQTAQVSTLVPLTALYIVIPVCLGTAFLGEPPTLRKGLGVVLALAAIYLLSSVERPA